MKAPDKFVSGGGWNHTEKQTARVGALCATLVAALWSMFWFLAWSAGYFDSGWQVFVEKIAADPYGHSLGVGMAVHPILVIVAIVFWVKEKPREITITVPREPQGGYLDKLY